MALSALNRDYGSYKINTEGYNDLSKLKNNFCGPFVNN